MGDGEVCERFYDPRRHPLCRAGVSGGGSCWPEWGLAVSDALRDSIHGGAGGIGPSFFFPIRNLGQPRRPSSMPPTPPAASRATACAPHAVPVALVGECSMPVV